MNPATGHENKHSYEFGAFRLDPAERVLARNGERISLPPKAFDTLLILVQHGGHVLGKDELIKTLWPDSFVEENNLTQQISQLRRALGEGADGQSYIETVPKLGYRFLPEVREILDGEGELLLSKRTRTHIVLRQEEVEESEEASEEPAFMSASQHTAADATRPSPSRQRSRVSNTAAISIAAAAGAVILIAGILLNKLVLRREQAPSLPTLKLIRLTTHGKAQNAAVSPDGKYVAYVSGDPGNQSLWVRQVATHSDIEIAPPAQIAFVGITFSHDGNFLYYVARRSSSDAFTVYRVPVLGGEARIVASKTKTTIGLSPDDRWIVYSRMSDGTSKDQLYVASSEGGKERQLTSDESEFLGLAAPTWSPDGKLIAAGVWSGATGTKRPGVWIFDPDIGGGRPLGTQDLTNVDSLTWLPDGKHLVMAASKTSSGPAGQIWELSYPAGQFRRITNDLTDYEDVSVTADSSTLATVVTEVPANVWVTPAGHPDAGRQITSGSVGFGGWSDLAWTTNEKIIYYSVAGGNQELWMMQADGSHQRRLTFSAGWKLQPATCPDGRTVVFTVVSEATVNLWRMDPDGSDLKQLTFKNNGESPACSADSNWIVFMGDRGRLQKMPVQGGAEIELTKFPARFPAASPDGKWIACMYFPEPEKAAIAVLSLEDGRLGKSIPLDRGTLPISSAGKLQWTPDGRALAYIAVRGGVSNIWSQPLDGSPPRPLTNFPSGQIFSFAWSPDGRQLAMTRGTISSDVVLISDFLH
jgi:Tol biopolymer transport system component/DNA-binding winged helix-turn-helix (wHTH) protein